jgi:hypothetical protein
MFGEAGVAPAARKAPKRGTATEGSGTAKRRGRRHASRDSSRGAKKEKPELAKEARKETPRGEQAPPRDGGASEFNCREGEDNARKPNVGIGDGVRGEKDRQSSTE